MLTQETKRKIDNARQILVGKIPDPKAQVEQITTALIYKFMDDMDRESEELGGKARFFANGFEKYAWGKLMDPKLSGHQRLDLYVEAITKMSRNPHLPQLFRDIFKDAFLPFRSPETLNLFLKEISSFNYSNSEDLGDAFEYLLSIMGSQGDAGQFRTPRHIIDFIVEVINPQKNETILDPACGTAGFLISAYKHIRRENKNKLTPDERKKLMNNLVGYDISPDMVKLSLVNMYLHDFPEPKIYEYDTLSSEDRWDETFDVIMANPPFMTPKGGIRPHKRFSVRANRSEVLFVDYILEHLNQKGRAGIIVPEGIIFQTANAYKELRRLLIEDGLFAVVSLPAGVFNPYSGVKTSILFFDNKIAKQADNILFIKITNDGYDLGAQRRKLDNDGELPIALQILTTYRKSFDKKINKKFKIDKSLDYLAWLTPKKKIVESGLPAPRPTVYIIKCEDGSFYIGQTKNLFKRWREHKQGAVSWAKRHKAIEIIHYEEFNTINEAIKREKDLKTGFGRKWLKREYKKGNLKKWDENATRQAGDYNLSGDRYKEKEEYKKQKWPMVELGEICDIYQPKTITSKQIKKEGKYKVFGANGVIGYFDEYNHEEPEIAITCRGATCGTVNFTDPKSWITGNAMVVKPKDTRINKRYLFYFLRNSNLKSVISGSAQPQITRSGLSPFKIPLPPLEVQKEIVERIEKKQEIINNAKELIAKIEKERANSGRIFERLDCKKIELGKVLKYEQPTKYIVKSVDYSDKYETPVLTAGKTFILGYTNEKEGIFPVDKLPVIIFDDFTTASKFVDFSFKVKSSAMKILHADTKKTNIKYLYYLMQNIKFPTNEHKRYWISEYSRIKIPLPHLDIQKEIANSFDKQTNSIKANQELIKVFEQQIQDEISEVWGE